MIKTSKELVEEISGFVRYAETEQEATHKFPTHVHWGKGYFGGMRHLVCDNSIAAFEVMKIRLHDCNWENLWRREAGEWINCKDLKD